MHKTAVDKRKEPVNKNASYEVRKVLEYLTEMSGKGIIAGQHTQTMVQKELGYIEELTGKLPALCGFELLAYSPNINYEESDDVCLLEVRENKNTLEKAWEWARKYKGLVTFTWHWFSPVGGKGKAFYAEHTDFDAREVLKEGTKERSAFFADMDEMVSLLRPFEKEGVPILWRPFHESEGTWFWWGAKGSEVARDLYLLMYDYFTNVHKLNNLIWVWNSPLAEGYVGDEYADIVSVDLYPEKHTHASYSQDYENLLSFTGENKIASLAEIGVVPDVEKVKSEGVPWSWFMLWSNEFCVGEEYSSKEVMKSAYQHEFTITLDKLPKLY